MYAFSSASSAKLSTSRRACGAVQVSHRPAEPRHKKGLARERVRLCFEGVPPGSIGGSGDSSDWYGPDEWREFDDDHNTEWNPVKLYLTSLQRTPVFTKTMTSVILGILADWVAQRFEQRRSNADFEWDRDRSFRFGGMAILGTPILHGWFAALDRIFPGMGFKVALKKALVDQLFFSVLANGFTLFGLYIMQGTEYANAVSKTLHKLPPTMLANYKLWPAAQLASFYFIPAEMRVLWINLVAFSWVVYLSFTAHK